MKSLRFPEQIVQEGQQLIPAHQSDIRVVVVDKKIVPIQSANGPQQFFEKRLRLLSGCRTLWECCLKQIAAALEAIGDRSRHLGVLPQKLENLRRFRPCLVDASIGVSRTEQAKEC